MCLLRCLSCAVLIQALGFAALSPAGLLEQAAVAAALEVAKRNEPKTLREEQRICQIPAPPFHEMERAKEIERRFREFRLQEVRIDEAGNVIGVRPGRAAHPNLVLSAHLDTVFPEGTEIRVIEEGAILKGPGISDDCRGLAVMLAVIQSLDKARVETDGTITFVATVGEEGLGDLRGVKELFQKTLTGKIDRFISVDGSGFDITNGGVGSHRYEVKFTGPGGHSFGSFGIANPIHAQGRAVAKIAEFQVPLKPKTTFNVGRIGGGTSVNSIASEAWMEVDLRSADAALLLSLDRRFQNACQQALTEENERWKDWGKLSVSVRLVGDRPSGLTSPDSALVQTALEVSSALHIRSVLGDGSTDANIPMSLNIPAITIGGGGHSTGSHTLNEAFDSTDSWQGTQRAVLLAVALAQ